MSDKEQTDPLCEATFERWSKEKPQKLIDFIKDQSNEFHYLTFAAEWAGHCRNALDPLIKLLEHEDCVVREGAIMGLENYYCEFIKKDLVKLLKAAEKHRNEKTESSPGVRERTDEFYERVTDNAESIWNCSFLRKYEDD